MVTIEEVDGADVIASLLASYRLIYHICDRLVGAVQGERREKDRG